MTIQPGEHPSTDPAEAMGHNKFLGLASEGHRGVLLAVRAGHRQAIVLAKTTSRGAEDGVRWGRLYLVEERDDDQWPQVLEEVSGVPSDGAWEIVVPRQWAT